ncbi:MAG: 3'(2'),5'-bisphosphate nucleotidase CysQ [Planctomycetes bacterium]|nr:3'(2'),5'-bisphosphate nucleotidase CysQ [Planctomycetota bacterium]
MKRSLDDLLRLALDVAVEAGRRTLALHGRDIPVELKADDSPLTLADRASHDHIAGRLGELTPEIPLLSEESPPEDLIDRRRWKRFWLVDPLDGTKEFIKRTGEYTVNIALVEGAEPVVGIVHAPVAGLSYFARRGGGAFRRAAGGESGEIRVRAARRDALAVVASKDHAGPGVRAFLERNPSATSLSMGSSLKLCLVAEGSADFYPRDLPTMEWDTAAAQCIVEAAGGSVTDLEGRRLVYNKESLRNPPFIAYGDGAIDWVRMLAPGG